MSKIYNVLVFPGGTEIGLEIHKALNQCKDIRLFSASLNTNHAPFVICQAYVLYQARMNEQPMSRWGNIDMPERKGIASPKKTPCYI